MKSKMETGLSWHSQQSATIARIGRNQCWQPERSILIFTNIQKHFSYHLFLRKYYEKGVSTIVANRALSKHQKISFQLSTGSCIKSNLTYIWKGGVCINYRKLRIRKEHLDEHSRMSGCTQLGWILSKWNLHFPTLASGTQPNPKPHNRFYLSKFPSH